MTGDRLGRHLLERGRVTGAQLDEARRTRAFFGGDLGTHLVRLGHLTEDELGRVLSELTGAPCADGRLRRIDPDVIARVPRDIAERHRLCPFEVDGGVLRVALRDPRNGSALAAAGAASGLEVEAWVVSDHRLDQALAKHFGIRREGVPGVPVPPPVPSPSDPGPRARGRTDSEGGDAPEHDAGPELGLDGLPLDAVYSPAEIEGAFGTGLPVTDDERAAGAQDEARPPKGADAPSGAKHAVTEPDDPVRPDPDEGAWSAAAPMPTVDALKQLEDRLELAVDRTDVALAVLDFLRLRAARCALFAVTRNGLRCLAGRGRGLDTDRLQRVVVPLGTGTVLDTALASDEFYLGPVHPVPENKDLYSLLGGRLPPSIVVVPIRLRGRTVAVMYLDNDRAPVTAPDPPLMARIAAKASLAFEMLLLRKKLREI